jgi:2'-5' RNA ligase
MRLFLAFPLPVEIITYVGTLQTRIKDIRLRLPDSPHLTIKFLGEVDEDKLDGLKKIIKDIDGRKITVKLGPVGAFADWTKPRVLWVGVEPAQEVIKLQRQVEGLLKDMFPPEEKFHPHITLARVKEDIDAATIKKIQKVIVEPREFVIDKLILYRSVLTGKGPVYSELMTMPLS